LAEWTAGPEHPLKVPLLKCAELLINGKTLPWPDGVHLMQEIGKYDAQRAALAIAYFASDCDTEEGDDALNQINEEIRRAWNPRGV
jgi:hypothetical protein